ncbi:MAG: hypothetical protein WB471_05315 [Nocardioides sp.]
MSLHDGTDDVGEADAGRGMFVAYLTALDYLLGDGNNHNRALSSTGGDYDLVDPLEV